MGITEKCVTSVQEIIGLKNKLTIPSYQRPYSWSQKNLIQLIDDILENKNKNTGYPYRLGTIILHKDKDELNIVDGQQRVTSLVLILHFLRQKQENIGNSLLSDLPLLNQKITNPHSLRTIQLNYDFIHQKLHSLSNDTSTNVALQKYILEKCEFVYVELDDISEAFQLFDSQNSRGKSLEPHDILKAYHLREIKMKSSDISSPEDDSVKKLIQEWEKNIENGKIKEIINNYLFRIRRWVYRLPSMDFNLDDISVFKGIRLNEDTKNLYPFLKPISYIENLVNNNEVTYPYPFSITQEILNGRRFFEYVNYYIKMRERLFPDNDKQSGNSSEDNENREIEDKSEIIKLLDTYEGAYRDGDRYVRQMFEAIILYYYDKFGEDQKEEIIKVAFLWCYHIRLVQHSVKKVSIDNKATQTYEYNDNLIQLIYRSINPKECLNVHLERVSTSDILSKSKQKYGNSPIDRLIEKFKELGYIYE
jgi:hypothetical protein